MERIREENQSQAVQSLMNKYGHSGSQNCHRKCLFPSFHRDWMEQNLSSKSSCAQTEKDMKELSASTEDNKNKQQSIDLFNKYTCCGRKIKDDNKPNQENVFDDDLNYPWSVHEECQNSSFLLGKDIKSNACENKINISFHKQSNIYPQNELLTVDKRTTYEPFSCYTQSLPWDQIATYALDGSNKYIGPYRGYGTHQNISPMYKTTAQDYGSKTPCIYHMTKVLHNINQNFSRTLIGRRQDGSSFNHGSTCRKNICAIIKRR